MLWYLIFNFSIFPAAVIAIARLRVTGRDWYPFTILLCLGFINELLSYNLYLHHHTPAVNNNIYTFIEYVLILLQFARWNNAGKQKYFRAGAAGFIIWAVDNIILHRLGTDNSLFRACYSFILVLLAIEQVNIRIISSNAKLRRDAVFIVCCGFILYFSCRAFMEIFHLFGVSFSYDFGTYLTLVMDVINFIANLVYITALLCIPMKQRYSWPS